MDEGYFQWRRIQRLQRQSRTALDEERGRLTEREAAFRQTYGTDSPADVDALDHADFATIEAVWEELREWETVRRRIRDLEAARRNQDRDGLPDAEA